MREVVRIEIKKALRTKGFLVSLLAGIIIFALQFFWFHQNTYCVNNEEYDYILNLTYMDNGYGQWFENTILEGWLGCEVYSPYNQLFFIAFPLLAAIPYAGSLFSEWQSGYAGQMIIRCGRKRYITAKFIAVYVSGGLAVAIPLLLSLVAAACYLPAIGVDPLSMQAPVSNTGMWAFLYYEYPVAYALCYTCLDFAFGGILACITLTVSKWFTNRFGAVLFPLILNCTLYYGISSLFPEMAPYNPALYINPSQYYGKNHFSALVVLIVVIMVALAGVYGLSNHRRDAVE